MSESKCEICGEPMPAGEGVFKFHGYSGPCPKEPLPKQSKDIWVVLGKDGEIIHAASWPEACHEHINDAINEFDIDGAEKWKVRRARLADE